MPASSFSRRTLLQAAAATGPLVMLNRRAFAADKMTIGFGTDVGYSGAYAAIKKGYFTEMGIDPEMLTTPSGPRSKQMLAAGQLTVASSGATDSIALAMAGKPSVLVFSTERRPAHGNILVHKDFYDAGLKTAKDLAGKKIGVTAPQGWTWLLAVYIGQALKIDKQLDIRPLGDMQTMLGALKSKSVESTIATFPMIQQAVRDGWGVPIFQAANNEQWNPIFGGDLPGIGFYVLKETIDKNPDMVARFVAGLSKGYKYVQTAPPTEVAALVKPDYFPNVPIETIAAGVTDYQKIWNFDGNLTADAYQRLVEIMGGGRMYPSADLTAKAKFGDMVDNRFNLKARGNA